MAEKRDRFGNVVSGSTGRDRFGGVLTKKEPEMSGWEQAGRALAVPATNFVKGIGNVMEGTEDFFNAIVDPLVPGNRKEQERNRDAAYEKYGFGALPSLPALAQSAGMKPRNAIESMLAEGGETAGEVTATLPLAYRALMSVAPALAGVGPQSNWMARAAKGFVDMASRAPASGDIISGFGSGVGSEGAALLTDHESPGAELAGGIAGGLAPAMWGYGPLGLTAKAAKGAYNWFLNPAAKTERAKAQIARELGPLFDQSNPVGREAALALQNAEALKQEIPGYNPSLAQASEVPSMIAEQNALESSASGDLLNQIVRNQRSNANAITSYAASRTPQAVGSADTVRSAIDKQVTGVRSGFDRAKDTISREEESLERALPRADTENIGDRIRRSYFDARDEAYEQMQKMARDSGIDSNAPIRGIPMAEFKNRLIRAGTKWRDEDPLTGNTRWIRDRAQMSKDIPVELLRKIANEGKSGQPPMTINDYVSYGRAINGELRDAMQGLQPNSSKAARLRQMRDEFEDIMNDVDLGNSTLNARWKDFRKRYKTEYIDRFKEQNAKKIAAKDGFQHFVTQDEQIAQKFFKSDAAGGISAAREYRNIFRDNPQALEDYRAIALDSLRNAATRNGRIDSKALDKWRNDHRQVLQVFPEIEREVSTLSGRVQALAERGRVLDEMKTKFENSALISELDRFKRGSGDVGAIIRNALENPTYMRELMANIRGNADAMAAMKRAVWEEAVSKVQSPAQFEKYLIDKAAPLEQVLGKDHFRSLTAIAEASRKEGLVPKHLGKADPSKRTSEIERVLNMKLPQLSSRLFAIRSGRTGWQWVASEMLSRTLYGFSNSEADKLMIAALYDADVAKQLAQFTRTPPTPKQLSRLHAYLANVGEKYYDDED